MASFARFTLLLVFALQDQFQQVRAFTFVDEVTEVTRALPARRRRRGRDGRPHREHRARRPVGPHQLRPGLHTFAEERAPTRVGPETSLLILGDARSNYSDLATGDLQGPRRAGPARLVAQPRAPAALGHRRLRRAGRTATIVPMVECRNLTQLGEFVHDLV